MEILQEFAMRILNSSLLSTLMLLIRFITPCIALYVLWRCYTSFRKGQRKKDPVIMLEDAATGAAFPVLYWENSIGRSRSCDIVIPDESVSRDHAVLIRREEGWFVSDTDSHLGVRVHGKLITEPTLVQIGDKIKIGPVTLILKNTNDANIKKRRLFTGFTGEAASPFSLMLSVVLVQLSMTLQLMFGTGEMRIYPIAIFAVLFAAEWILYFFSRRVLRRVSFETETFGLLLSSIGIILISGQGPDAVKMQILTFLLGLIVFCIIVWFVSDLERVMKSRTAIAICALLLFALNLVIGSTVNGSKNWIMVGPVSFQPSEFIKIAFIFVGAATLDRLQTKKNLTVFILFAGACLGSLFIMRDFGTALIFFATFLIIAFMRSGSFRTVFLALAAAFFGVFMILQFRPYVAKRFAGWMHVWEHTQDSLGYQQVRTMTYIASGGLGGLGIGNGCLKYVAASDSDLVFGMLCEEQGLLMGLTVLFGLALLVLYARSDVTRSRSTFYAIASCAAAGMLLFQTCLNVFGPTDILPLTGVTLPFISAGGSSMLSTWGLLAFLKAADERTYAAKRGGRRSAVQHEAEDIPYMEEPEEYTEREPVKNTRFSDRATRHMEVRIPEEELHPDNQRVKRKGGVKHR